MSKADKTTHQCTLDGDETPSEVVYSAVAALENCSPLELDPLAKMVDPDALDALLTKTNQQKQISFQYHGHEVTATPMEIRVREPDAE